MKQERASDCSTINSSNYNYGLLNYSKLTCGSKCELYKFLLPSKAGCRSGKCFILNSSIAFLKYMYNTVSLKLYLEKQFYWRGKNSVSNDTHKYILSSELRIYTVLRSDSKWYYKLQYGEVWKRYNAYYTPKCYCYVHCNVSTTT